MFVKRALQYKGHRALQYKGLHIYATTREWEEKKEQDKVEEVEEGGVCGKTTEFVLAKLHQTVSFTKHSLNPPR